MTDLDKARGWAEENKGNDYLAPRIEAAIDVILSLPDQWVDAGRLRQIIDFQGSSISDEARKDLETLFTPKLPTLADMTEAERKACQWMQCKVETDDGDTIGVIRRIWSSRCADILYQSGMSLDAEYRRVTPLPDLPKLQWPGSEVVEPPALPEGMRLADHETLGRIVVSQRADEDGDYAFFESIPGGIAGASWGYVNKSELTFLDGGQHV